MASLAVTGGSTLFLVPHTEARYLLPAVPFILYFALRSVEAALTEAQRRWRGWSGLRRVAVAALCALSLAAVLQVGVHQAILEEDPLYRADLERRAAERLLAARTGSGRLLWHGRWHTLHTRWVRLVPHDEFFGIYHFPAFAIQFFLDRDIGPQPSGWPRDPDKLALVLGDGDAVLRTADPIYDAWHLPDDGVPAMEVRSARALRFRLLPDGAFAAVADPALRIRLQPDGLAGEISASPLSGRWQILARAEPSANPRFVGTVTLSPGIPAEFTLLGRGPVAEIELFQLQSSRIE
jgi:hypothetical protein